MGSKTKRAGASRGGDRERRRSPSRRPTAKPRASVETAGPRPEERVITLTTDFGLRDPFVGILKGVILSIHPGVRLVDLSHEVAPQDALGGGFLVGCAIPYFPPGTIHVAVVDPGVGTQRRILAVDAGGQLFVAPDNGLLSVALRGIPVRRVVRVASRRYFRRSVSATFHGRDIFAPVAAHLARGVDLSELGPPSRMRAAFDVPVPRAAGPGRLRGQVIQVDRFGNLITNVDEERLRRARGGARGGRVSVEIDHQRIARISRTYGDGPSGELLALLNSFGYLEIACRRGSAAERLGRGVGTPVTVRHPVGRRRR